MDNVDKDKVSYRVYFDENFKNKIIIQEYVEQLSCGTTGLSCWQASSVLASVICFDNEFKKKYNFKDKSVLELGAGCGLTGIAIKVFAGVGFLKMTDCNELVIKQLMRNVEINKLDCKEVSVSYLNWKDEINEVSNYDYIIAADVIYDTSILDSLLKTVSVLLKETSSTFIIASTLRNQETIEKFENQIVRNNLLLLERRILDDFKNVYLPFSTTINAPTIIHFLKSI
uniref:FAM86 domain-containing protein n=1 Tax=Strongyloides papillosus TaxID=174720 RepID=A0A0N5C861_STREA